MTRSPDPPITRSAGLTFLLSAGEASGDTYGAQLIEALRQFAPSPQDAQNRRAPGTPAHGSIFFGMGGEKMRAAGADLLVHAHEVAVVGLIEVVTHLPGIRRRFRHLVAEAARRKPDAAILIDFPDFNLRLARELHRLGIPVFYFVSPQIWAWRTGRVKQIKKYVRKMIVIFPFEQEFYARHGVEVSYVGHPLAYVPPPQISREEFAAKHHLDPGKQWIALLPGSRRKEVRLNLPAMIQSAGLLQQQSTEFEFLLPVASTLNQDWLSGQLEQIPGLKPEFITAPNAALKGRSSTEGRPCVEGRSPTGLTSNLPMIRLTDNARATLMHARAAVVASGTATVEAALSGTPFVVVYRLAPLTWLLGRRLVKLDTFAMPNLIAGRKIVPELIQKDFTAQNVFRELNAIIRDGSARQQMESDLRMAQQRLRDSGDSESPSQLAAKEILGSINQPNPH
jgi:lipid-A-disaccharide synthase